MRSVALELSDVAALQALERRLAEASSTGSSGDFSPARETGDGQLALRDPDGHALTFFG